MTSIHDVAARGFAAGSAAYAGGRPDYPPAVADWLRDALGIRRGATVVELGAGTGKFTPLLAETGAEVIAVEPVAEMRARLAASFPSVHAVEGAAEAIPCADGAADAIVCAQSFHWFANRGALAEMRRVLRPGGALGLIWNMRDGGVGWVAALQRLIAPYRGDAPDAAGGRWQALFPAEGFTPLEERRFPHLHAGPPESVIVGRTLSSSFIAALPGPERAKVADRVRALVAATPELAGRGEVVFPYRTHAYACRKIG